MLGYFNSYIQIYWRTPVKRTYTELGLSLLLVIIFLIFAIRPTLETASKLYQGNQEAQQLTQKLSTKLISLNQARQIYQTQSKRLSYLETAVPPQTQILSFLNQISFLARESGLSVIRAEASLSGGEKTAQAAQEKFASPLPEQYQTEEYQPQVSSLQFKLSLQGDFQQLQSFVSQTENFPRLVRMIQVEFARLPAGEDSTQLSLNLTGQVYIDQLKEVKL